MASMIELENTEWALVEDLFDPPWLEVAALAYLFARLRVEPT